MEYNLHLEGAVDNCRSGSNWSRFAKFTIESPKQLKIVYLVKIQHNPLSRFYEYSAQGQIVLKGNVRQSRELTINLLMEDYMHFIKTVHKNV